MPNYTHSKVVEFYQGWSIEEINNFKWWLTLFFTFGFMFICWLALYVTKYRKIATLSVLMYGGIFVLSFAISFFAMPVATEMMHLLHSPVPFLLLLGTIQLKRTLDGANNRG